VIASDPIRAAIDALPPLPEVAVRVVEIVNDPDFSTDHLVAVVRTDPTLTTRVLKLCNSSLFALSREVHTVADAIAYLGSRRLVKLVLATCSMVYFRALDGAAGDSETLWRHSLATGILAQHLGERSEIVAPGTAFTAGILHDIGKVVLAPFADRSPGELAAATAAKAGDFLAGERALTGFDHAVVGGMVADRWQLPVDLRRAIRHHHSAALIMRDNPLTAVVHVADVIADQLGCGARDAFAYGLLPEATALLTLADDDLHRVRLDAIDEIERSEDLLKLE
jgi:putative nucleotidyltransferase with HDIG domain